MGMIERILVVDDDHELRALIVEWLTFHNYRVHQAVSALAAIEALREESYDLLITDFQMPGLDGLGLLGWCRKHEIHFPVVFITASAVRLEREQLALNDCCAESLRKPLTREKLIQAVSEAAGRDHFECEPPTENRSPAIF